MFNCTKKNLYSEKAQEKFKDWVKYGMHMDLGVRPEFLNWNPSHSSYKLYDNGPSFLTSRGLCFLLLRSEDNTYLMRLNNT